MDGVLIDSEPFQYEASKIVYTKLNIDVSQEINNSFVGLAAEKMWGFLKKHYGLKKTISELIEYDDNIRIRYMSQLKNIKPIRGIQKLLKKLSQNNFPLAIASSSSRGLIDILTKKADLRKYFSIFVSGDDVQNGKPDPDIFLHTASLLGILPSECIVVEDSSNGVRAAKAAKMKCIGFKNPNSGNQDLSMADMTVSSIRALTVKKMKSIDL